MAEPEGDKEAHEGPFPVWVQLIPAKPNPMFTEEQRKTVVFLRYALVIPCAECGKRSKYHWTMILSFAAQSMKPGMFTLAESGTVHLPLAPVCRSHLLRPAPLPAAPKRARPAPAHEPGAPH